MGFIIRIKCDGNIAIDDYVSSPKTYAYQGDKYIPLSGRNGAYVFKNRYSAEKCKEKLTRCVNIYGKIEIIELRWWQNLRRVTNGL